MTTFATIALTRRNDWQPGELGRFDDWMDAVEMADRTLAHTTVDAAVAVVLLDPEPGENAYHGVDWRGRGWLPLDIEQRITAAAARLRHGERL
jgi:hypothetical protein